MNDRIWDSAGALAGIIAPVLVLVGMGIAQGESPGPQAPSAELARVLVDQSDRVTIGMHITLVGLVFFFPFLAYFRRRLQQAEGDGGWLASAAYGGGLVTVAMLLLMVSMSLATTAVSDTVDVQVAKVFVVYFWSFILVFAPPMIALTLAASLAIVRYAALPRWTGWIGFLVAVTLLMPWIGVLVFMAWLPLVGIVLLIQVWRAPQQERASVQQPAAA